VRRAMGVARHGGERMPWGKGVIASGTFVFLAGVEGRHPETDVVSPEIGEQIEITWNKIKERLEEAGTDCEHIVHMLTFVTDMDEWARHGGWYQDRWLRKNAPAILEEGRPNTLIQVPRLHLPEMKVEIHVTAVIPD